MNRDQIYEELARLTALADGWRKASEIPAIERDLMLARLRGLYGTLLFESTASESPEEPLHAAAAVAAAEEDETNEIIDIELDDFEEPAPAAPDAATADEESAPGHTAEEPETEEESLPEIEVEIVTDFESAFDDEEPQNGGAADGEEPAGEEAVEYAAVDAQHAAQSEPTKAAPATEEPTESESATVPQESQESSAAAEHAGQTELTPESAAAVAPEDEPAAENPAEENISADETADKPAAIEPEPEDEPEPAAENPAEESISTDETADEPVAINPESEDEPEFAAEEPAEESASADETAEEPAAIKPEPEDEPATEPEDEPVFIVETPAPAAEPAESAAEEEILYDEQTFIAEPATTPEPEAEPAAVQAGRQEAMPEEYESEFIVEEKTEAEAARTAGNAQHDAETPHDAEPDGEDVAEFIVEPAPAAESGAAKADVSRQSNLFGFDSVAAPRRSRQRMISLYDDDLFERIPVRKADKTAQQDDEPRFEVEPARAERPTEPEPQHEEPQITAEAAPETAGTPAAAESVAEFIVDDEPSAPAGGTQKAAPAAEPAKVVLGDVLGSNRRTIADSMAARQTTTADALAHAPVADLAGALSIGDRYRIESELFGGDAELCRRTLATLDGMESLDDAVIYIEENFSWHPSSEAACMIMELLERKFS